MLQILLLAMLSGEAALYVWLCGSLGDRGVGIPTIVATLLLIAIVWRLSHALGSFVVASILRWRDRRTLPWGNSAAALANEFAARFVCFNWSQPFQSIAMGVEPWGRKDGVPILLVHGYLCNRGLWVALRQKLAAARLGPIYTVTLSPLFGGIDGLVAKLDARIEAICSETGAAKVMVVAHSMGGLVVRAYLVQSAAARIARLVTLGSPHHGTQLARWGLGANSRQMQFQSEWLAMLADREAVAADVPATLSIYTLNDDLVYPPESSALEWAENVPVAAVGHIGLVFSDAVAMRVIQQLR